MREDDGFCFYLLPKDMVIASLSPSLSFSTWRSTCLSQYGPTACPSLPPLNLSLPPVSHYVPTACLSPSGSATCFSLSGPTAYHLPPVSLNLGLPPVSHHLSLPPVTRGLSLTSDGGKKKSFFLYPPGPQKKLFNNQQRNNNNNNNNVLI